MRKPLETDGNGPKSTPMFVRGLKPSKKGTKKIPSAFIYPNWCIGSFSTDSRTSSTTSRVAKHRVARTSCVPAKKGMKGPAWRRVEVVGNLNILVLAACIECSSCVDESGQSFWLTKNVRLKRLGVATFSLGCISTPVLSRSPTS